MGVPVIAVGVPTVVDARTLAGDLLGNRAYERDLSALGSDGRQMIVIPREIDLLTERAARLIALSLNSALQSSCTPEELMALT